MGIAQGALDAAIAYVKERKQFGKPIGDFQAVQFMLADMAMKLEAARLLVYTAAARAERGEPNLGFLSAASKCYRMVASKRERIKEVSPGSDDGV